MCQLENQAAALPPNSKVRLRPIVVYLFCSGEATPCGERQSLIEHSVTAPVRQSLTALRAAEPQP